MSVTINSEKLWFDRYEAANYLHAKGYAVTDWTIIRDAKTGKLHEGRRVGRRYLWHRSWLDEYASAQDIQTERASE